MMAGSYSTLLVAHAGSMQTMAALCCQAARHTYPLTITELAAWQRWHRDLNAGEIVAMRAMTGGGRFMVIDGGRRG